MSDTAPPPWQNLVAWFLACFQLPASIHFGATLDPDTRQPVATFLTAPDGSWCVIGNRADAGRYLVTEFGPTPLWRHVEAADQLWRDAGHPGWERLGLSVTGQGQYVWLDDPHGNRRWPLRAR